MRNKLIIFAILFQILSLCFMYVNSFIPIYFGESIVVKTVPKDPRDMFRGNYVDLAYDFSNSQSFNSSIDILDVKKDGSKIYAVLKKDGEIFKFDRLDFKRPKDEIYITGILNCSKMYIYCHPNFGIDAYFLPKDKALFIEDMQREQKDVFVNLMVLKNGNVRIKNLIIDDKIY